MGKGGLSGISAPRKLMSKAPAVRRFAASILTPWPRLVVSLVGHRGIRKGARVLPLRVASVVRLPVISVGDFTCPQNPLPRSRPSPSPSSASTASPSSVSAPSATSPMRSVSANPAPSTSPSPATGRRLLQSRADPPGHHPDRPGRAPGDRRALSDLAAAPGLRQQVQQQRLLPGRDPASCGPAQGG